VKTHLAPQPCQVRYSTRHQSRLDAETHTKLETLAKIFHRKRAPILRYVMQWGIDHGQDWTADASIPTAVHLVHIPVEPEVLQQVQEAAAFTQRLVEGKHVRLEYDQQRQDKYGRTLAYVYLDDGTFVNAEIIMQGYGFAYIRFPFKYLNQVRQLERDAREAKRGLWQER
jgi:Staphylococcal nuclease homologue